MFLTLTLLLIPFAVFATLGVAGKRFSPRAAGTTATVGIATVAGLSYLVAWRFFFDGDADMSFTFRWLNITDRLHIDVGALIDPLSVMMLTVISTVSLAVHVYSLGYMRGERGFQRYYAFLALFTFAMLGLTLATNLFQMYIFWELVGVSSYLLIGFYYAKPAAVAASKKAFIVTRFADLGFLVGILILSSCTGTFDFALLTDDNASLVVASTAGMTFLGLSAATWAMLLLFAGGAGKSAMFPLHIWLPDAMEGPTPVSALIHAATMVVAGVYLVARLFAVYLFAAPEVLRLIAAVGGFTALFAAIVAITQTDIKRVLAFSTISQIAYMMAALGVAGYGVGDGSGYSASLFHLFTHAFFKALLFLGAGAVIHAVHSNEVGTMGGLFKHLPVTALTFLVACLAISGIPPFSGFFSKDEILVAVMQHNKPLFFTLWLTAGLTAFYMFRLYFSIFHGKKRHYEHPPHEAPPVMLAPLVVLAALTCVAGLTPFDKYVNAFGAPSTDGGNATVAALSLCIALAGIILAAVMYARPSILPDRIAAYAGKFYRFALHKFYIDEIWLFVCKRIIFKYFARPAAEFDRRIIDGVIIDGTGRNTEKLSRLIRNFQSGYIQYYVIVFIGGVLTITVWMLFG
jgi:NADH-quinone oxidoreductase subunit L